MRSTKEYSKRVLGLMVLLWFLGAIFGAAVIVVELSAVLNTDNEYSAYITIHLSDLLMYIGAPITGGIVSYLIKSALENREKIKKSETGLEIDGIPNDNPYEP